MHADIVLYSLLCMTDQEGTHLNIDMHGDPDTRLLCIADLRGSACMQSRARHGGLQCLSCSSAAGQHFEHAC